MAGYEALHLPPQHLVGAGRPPLFGSTWSRATASDVLKDHARSVAMGRSRDRILWSNPGNAPEWIARTLGMEPRRFSRALHKIKAAADLSGADRVVIYSDGSVTDGQGEPLGNLHDED